MINLYQMDPYNSEMYTFQYYSWQILESHSADFIQYIKKKFKKL